MVSRVKTCENADFPYSRGRTKMEVFEYHDVKCRIQSMQHIISMKNSNTLINIALVPPLLGFLSSLIA